MFIRGASDAVQSGRFVQVTGEHSPGGDAAVGFTGMDFETAVREGFPILAIVLNNSCMACDLDLMPVATSRFRSTEIGGNYADFARALGGYGERVTQPADIAPALRRGIERAKDGVPTMLEFITEKAVDLSFGK
jgi:acetolactate synthase I/II/III large subunit